MKKFLLITLILFYLILNVSAINDINFTVDSGDIKYCISSKNASYYTCNETVYLTFSGTQDHKLRIMPDPMGDPKNTGDYALFTEIFDYYLRTPFLFIAILIIGLMVVIAYAIVCLFFFKTSGGGLI